MTLGKPSAQASTGRQALVLALLLLVFGGGGYYLYQISHPAPIAVAAPPETHSALLGVDLPGTSPLSDSETTEAALNVARSANLACTTTQELYGLSDTSTALSAMNQRLQAENYDRVNVYSDRQGTIFKTTMPKPLFAMVTDHALFLCEY